MNNNGEDVLPVDSLVDLLDGNISHERARELLEANSGSIERAIELHFLSTHSTTPTRHSPPNDHKASSRAPENEHNMDSPSMVGSEQNHQAISKTTRSVATTVGKQSPSHTSISPKSKRRRLQSTMDAFVTSPPVKNCNQRGGTEQSVETRNTQGPQTVTKSLQSISAKSNSPLPSVTTTSQSNSASKHISGSLPSEYNANDEDEPHRVTSTGKSSNASSRSTPPDNNPLAIPYTLVAEHMATVAGTTKRTLKIQALQSLFSGVLARLRNHTQLGAQALVLHQTLDLVLGKLTVLTNEPEKVKAESTPISTNLTLQVSGAAISKALQVVLGISPTQMRQAYRRTGDLGDVAADALDKKSSVKSFFVSVAPNKSTVFTVADAHQSLQALATVQSGKGSIGARHEILVKLFRAAQQSKDMLRFLVRTALGNMRLGATLKTILAALAMTVSEATPPDAKADGATKKGSFNVSDRLQKVYNVCPRLNEICLALLKGGLEYAEAHCSLALGYPVEPMLANPAHSLAQVEQFLRKSNGSAAVAEWKYDGVRCQAHFDRSAGDAVKLFSRHLLDQSVQYPDASSYLLEAASKPVHSFICDAEIVAVARHEGGPESDAAAFRILPFQDLRRGTSANNQGLVRVYCFDLLYLNGQSLLKSPLFMRQKLLREHFAETDGFAFAESTQLPPVTANGTFEQEIVADALSEAVKGGAEGLMVKLTGQYDSDRADAENDSNAAHGFYESGTRSHEWLKVKRDYVGGSFAETIDVVPIGAWYGNGRKAKAGYLSPVLLAVYDEDDGIFRSISRCMSFSDSMYEGMRSFYFDGIPYPDSVESDNTNEHRATAQRRTEEEPTISDHSDDDAEAGESRVEGWNMAQANSFVNCFETRPPSTVIMTNENPPIWFKPMEVFEVAFADLSLSRTHTAAAGLVDDKEGRGVALRFPRFKRRRPDKSPEQATTSAQIAQLFYQQSKMAQ